MEGNVLAAGRQVFLIPLAIYEPYALTSPKEKIESLSENIPAIAKQCEN